MLLNPDPRLRLTGLVMAAVVALSLPSTAVVAQTPTHEATGVLYLFAPQVIGGERSYALVPVLTSRLRADMPPRVGVPAAFDALRADKPATYEGASLRLTDADLAAGQAVLQLSGPSAANAAIIVAEAIYNFSIYGIERVVVPGIFDEGVTRADVGFASYRLQVPLWQALPPALIPGADVVLADGQVLPIDVVQQRWTGGDAALRADLLAFLAKEDAYALYGALARVAAERPPGHEAAIIPLLRNPDPGLRQNAMDALAASADTAAWDAILTSMGEDPEPSLRARAAGLLASSPLQQYHLFATFHRVETVGADERPGVVRELGTISDERAHAHLVTLLRHPEPPVVAAAVDALHTAGQGPRLVAALAEEEIALPARLRASRLLAGSEEPSLRLAGLGFEVQHLEGEGALLALEHAAEVPGAPARALVESALTHPDERLRHAAAGLLGQRGEREALPALLGVLGRPAEPLRVTEAAGDAAFAIVVGLPVDEIARMAATGEPVLRRAALRAWGMAAAAGQTAPDPVEAALGQALSDPTPEVRGAAALGLAHVASDSAFEQVLGAAEDESDVVLADVARALGAFAAPGQIERSNPVLAGFVQGGDVGVQAWALRSIGRLGLDRLLPIVVQRIESSAPDVRAAALEAAADLGQAEQPRSVINAITGRVRDPEVGIRVVAVQQLGRFNHELAVLGISQVINERDPDVRLAAILALGDTGHPGAIGPLVAILEEGDPRAGRVAVGALATLGLRDAVSRIEGVRDRIDDAGVRAEVDALLAQLRSSGR